MPEEEQSTIVVRFGTWWRRVNHIFINDHMRVFVYKRVYWRGLWTPFCKEIVREPRRCAGLSSHNG